MKRIKPYSLFENTSNTITLYHGGDLELFDYTIKPTKTNKGVHGPGLYLTNDLEVARGYAKGSRKLYEVEFELGTELKDITYTRDEVSDLLQNFYAISGVKKAMIHFERAFERLDGTITGDMVDAIIFNNRMVMPKKSDILIKEYIKKGADYLVDSNTFGFGDKTYIVYNLRKIKDVKRIK